MHNKLDTLRELYEGHSPRSHRFRDSLFIFDLAAITYVIVSSFWPPIDLLSWINRMFGVLVLADLTARIAIGVSYATLFSAHNGNSATVATWIGTYQARDAEPAIRACACELDALVAMAGLYAAKRYRPPQRRKWADNNAGDDLQNAMGLSAMAAVLHSGRTLPDSGIFTLPPAQSAEYERVAERLRDEIEKLVEEQWPAIEAGRTSAYRTPRSDRP